MKTLIAIISLMIMPGVLLAQAYVHPYTRQNGTYVEGHYRTAPDNSRLNNWTTQGNVNPYNGNRGTQPAYDMPRLPSLPSLPHTVYDRQND